MYEQATAKAIHGFNERIFERLAAAVRADKLSALQCLGREMDGEGGAAGFGALNFDCAFVGFDEGFD